MPQTPWYLYVLRCGDGTLYAGVTCDLPRRLAQHQQGRGARYTRSRGPLALAATWIFPDQAAALRAEAAFKRLRRAAKEGWIAGREPLADGGFVGALRIADVPEGYRCELGQGPMGPNPAGCSGSDPCPNAHRATRSLKVG